MNTSSYSLRSFAGVVWHACGFPGCDFKAKQACQLGSHRANRHDVGVVWHHCKYPGCVFKAKKAGNLKQHERCKHDSPD